VFKLLKTSLILACLMVVGSGVSSASPILDGWLVNIDGIFASFGSFATATSINIPNIDVNSTFDAGTIDNAGGGGQIGPGGTGLGTLGINVLGTGAHVVSIVLDLHLDTGSFDYFNEFGTLLGTPESGLTWQIGDLYDGDPSGIFANFLAGGALPNTNNFPDALTVGDVAVAFRYSFTIDPASSGTRVKVIVGQTLPEWPGDRFYIAQNSTNVGGDLFFSSELSSIPEPSAWILLASGAVALAFKFRRRSADAARQ
jgi:hypothetical protein